MSTWSWCKAIPYLGWYSFQSSLFFRKVPSPLQGTSHKILSNLNNPFSDFKNGNLVASLLVTINPGLLIQRVWWVSKQDLFVSFSFAITNPVGIFVLFWCNYSNIWTVLDPGDAHISSTVCSGFMSINRTGIIETNSCLNTQPRSL